MATTVTRSAADSYLSVPHRHEDTALVVAAWSAQQKETDSVAMGALEKAHAALEASEARCADLLCRIAALEAKCHEKDRLYNAEKSAWLQQKTALDEKIRVLEAAIASREASISRAIGVITAEFDKEIAVWTRSGRSCGSTMREAARSITSLKAQTLRELS